ncbi:41297_t:CDS:2, partial [Gigaspora margarita]
NIGFSINGNLTNNIKSDEVKRIEITGSTDVLTTFRNLIFLKDDVKEIGNDITGESNPGAKDRILKLSVADFSGQLHTDKIVIDDLSYPGNSNQINVAVNRHNQKQALLDLEKLLNITLPNKYPGSQDFEHGPDVDLIDPSADLGIEPDPTATPPVAGTELSAYFFDDVSPTPLPKEPENIKHILFDLKDDQGDKYLYGMKIFYGLNLTKKSHFAIVFDGTLGGGYSQIDETEIQKEPGFYKGFPLIDPNLKATPDPTNNKFKVEIIDPNKPVRYTKENIDNFRNFANGYTGLHNDIFTKEKTINTNGQDVQVYANREPEECFGFQPGDIYVNVFGDYFYFNGDQKFDGSSKMVFDIYAAQNAEEAMDLAFFGKDYDEPQSDNATRKGVTRQEALDAYYESLKEVIGATPALKYDDPATKDKIDEGYRLAKEFITDYELWLSVNMKSLGKTELAGLKNRGSELAKKIYQKCQPDQDGFTEAVFTELKKLVKLLDETYDTPTADTKRELEQFISESKTNVEKKKALDIAKTVKNQDSDRADCVATALEKLTTPQDKKLAAAREKLKTLLSGLKIGGKDAYEEMIVDIKDSEAHINQAIAIFQKCQEIDAATHDDDGKLLNALNNFKNDANSKAAWDAINKYKKDGQAEQRKNNYQDIRNAKTPAEFQAAKVAFMKKTEYTNNKQDYDEIYFPLAEKAAEIREKGAGANSEEKDLIELIVVYEEGGEKHNIVKNYSTTQKEALKKLISKMEMKVQE